MITEFDLLAAIFKGGLYIFIIIWMIVVCARLGKIRKDIDRSCDWLKHIASMLEKATRPVDN